MNKFLKEVLAYKGQGEIPGLSYLVSLQDQKLDDYFGVHFDQIEKELNDIDEQFYPSHEAPALLTSYLDYHQIFLDLGPTKTLIDLGAGYCRGTMLACDDESYGIKCISYEIIKARTAAAIAYLERTKKSKDYIVHQDLLSPQLILPDIDAFYLYLPTGSLLNNILRSLICDCNSHPIVYVCESHGDLVDTMNFYHEYFEKLPSTIKTSLTRHDTQIHKYQLIGTQAKRLKDYNQIKLDDIKDQKKIALWILKFGEQNIEVTIQSIVANQGSTRKWRVNLNQLALIKYNGQRAIYLPKKGRILQIGDQDEIIQVIESDSLSH